MRRLRFDYSMEIAYTEPVEECHYTIKCIPPHTARQCMEKAQIVIRSCRGEHTMTEEIFPVEEADGPCKGTDSFGNRFVYGKVSSVHDRFLFRATGLVTVGSADSETMDREGILPVYRHPYGLNLPGEGLKAYFASLRLSEEMSDYEKSVELMHRLYRDFSYGKDVTDVTTTAEEAWQLGKGVCQDYAHILIALCHMAGIPARYVAGMLVGEGYSHAWVEVLCQGRWYALDPTNDMLVTDAHIKLGVGRHAADCMINRGVIRGGGSQRQTVNVIVTPV